MSDKDFIKEFWESQAEKYGESPKASWADNYMIDLEIKVISEYIKSGQHVLDVGCANGHSVFRQFALNKHINIEGIDFSRNMIEAANKKKIAMGLNNEIKFAVGDVREIKFDDNTFDVVYTTRVLINLPNWETQKNALMECVRVARPGGTIVFCEAFFEPLVKLNAMRLIENLPPLVEHDFNRYIKKNLLDSFLQEANISYEVNNFSAIYYFGSRFLRELVTNPSDYPGYSNPINEYFYNLEKTYSGGSVGIQQAYIIKK